MTAAVAVAKAGSVIMSLGRYITQQYSTAAALLDYFVYIRLCKQRARLDRQSSTVSPSIQGTHKLTMNLRSAQCLLITVKLDHHSILYCVIVFVVLRSHTFR
jgi:hypothetical protein